jgi:hypothetical protein
VSKGLTQAEAKATIMNFAGFLNFRVPLDYKIRDTWKALYGVDGTGGGGFHSASAPGGRGVVTIAAGNHKSSAALQRTLQHEVLGHFLINTYPPAEKRQIIENIISSENSPHLSANWDKVKTIYPDMPLTVQAEEVYASVAERLDLSRIPSAEEDTCLHNSNRLITTADIENSILNRVRDLQAGALEQKTFPDTDIHTGPFISANLERRLAEWRVDHGVDRGPAPTEPSGPRI